MNKESFIAGITKKYPEALLEGRLEIEGSVIACLWKDPMLFDDSNFKKEHFITKDGRFFYGLGKTLRNSGLHTFDEVSILSSVNGRVQEEFEKRGGYETIENMVEVIDLKNFDGYQDQLYRENALIKLWDMGIDLRKSVVWHNKQVEPLEVFRKMTSEQVVEFYDSMLMTIDVGTNSNISERTDLRFTKEWLESLSEGEQNGTPYDRSFDDIDGNKMSCFPRLSNRTSGLLPGYVHMIGGFSSVGKSTLLITLLMALLYREHKIVVFSNEEGSDKYKIKCLSWLLAKYTHHYIITKNKLVRGDFDVSDENIDIVCQWWEKYCGDNIQFIKINDANINVVTREARKYVLDYGFDVVVYDTFKIQNSDMKDKRQDLALIRDIRTLDQFAKKYGTIVLTTVQLAESMKGKLWLDASCLSNSKQIKEQLENLFLIRNVTDEELDPDSKVYIRPFNRYKENGRWIEKDVALDRTKSWVVLFLEKSRNGANSANTNTAIILKFDGDHSLFEEYCSCRPRHGQIS